MSEDFEREERAFAEALRSSVPVESFRPLDPEALKAAAGPPRSNRNGWFKGLAAAAAIVVAVGAGAIILPRLGAAGSASSGTVAGVPMPASGAAAPMEAQDRGGAPSKPQLVGSWKVASDSPLSGRRSAAGAWFDGRFYLVGGWAGEPCPPTADCLTDGKALSDGAIYDPVSDRWSRIATAPIAVAGEAPVVVGGLLYFRSALGEPNALAAYDPAQDTWTGLAPTQRSASLVAAGDTLLSIGSGDGESQAVDRRYDPAERAWTALPDDPPGRSRTREAVWVNGRLLLAAQADHAGELGAVAPDFVQLAEFDLGTMTWHKLGESKIVDAGAVAVGDRVVWPHTGSGRSGSPSNSGPWPLGGIYDPASQTWTDLPDAPGEPFGIESADGVVAAGKVIANTHLLDPLTEGWTRLTPPPFGNFPSPAVVGSPNGILVFGGRSGDTNVNTAAYLPLA